MQEPETALRAAMEAHGDAVYRLALCRTQSVPDAEDVYQDVFLSLLRQKDWGWEDEHQKAWLLRAALNRCADLGRARLRRQTLCLEELPEMEALGPHGGLRRLRPGPGAGDAGSPPGRTPRGIAQGGVYLRPDGLCGGGLAFRIGDSMSWLETGGFYTGCLLQVTGEHIETVSLSLDRGAFTAGGWWRT